MKPETIRTIRADGTLPEQRTICRADAGPSLPAPARPAFRGTPPPAAFTGTPHAAFLSAAVTAFALLSVLIVQGTSDAHGAVKEPTSSSTTGASSAPSPAPAQKPRKGQTPSKPQMSQAGGPATAGAAHDPSPPPDTDASPDADASPDGDASPDADATSEEGEAPDEATSSRRLSSYQTKSLSIPAGQTVIGDRYLFGNGCDIDGRLEGDFFAFSGGNNNISGTVTEDVNVCGSNLNITGEVLDDVRVMAGEVTIKGRLGGDLLGMAGQVRVQKGAIITGQTSVMGGQIVLSGDFRQNVRAAGGQVTFGGTAAQNVDIQADVLKLEPGARIDGNLTYKSRSEIDALKEGGDARKQVAGTVTYLPRAASRGQKGSHAGFHLLWELWTFLTAFVLGCLIIAIARRPVDTILETMRRETLKSVGFGLIGHIFAPFAGLILILLCLTLPAGILVLVAWGVFFYLAKLVVSASLADTILRKIGWAPSPYVALLLGMIPVWILFRAPVLGSLLYWFVVPILGIGAILVGMSAYSRKWRSVAAVQPAAPAPSEPATGI